MNSILDQQHELIFINFLPAEKIIPPITNPLGQNWEQPRLSEIKLNHLEALMTKKAFNKLAEYSCSIPSGTYIGKMWKKNRYAFSRDPQHKGLEEWVLCWFSEDPDPKYLKNNYRNIILI